MTTTPPGHIASAHLNNRVGPVLRQGELAKAVAEAAEIDNPGKVITLDDKVAYLRVSTEGEMILRRETIEEMLGKPFRMSELEVELSSFSGRIENNAEQVRFYFEKKL
ncbi:toluene 4-monooxygenase protein D [Panacagrimonas perspica]|uniref:Toluene 4-monooxygenase protein D n=1 Tax=Panacagrimonas perspica TaxID=381431 RepID=A0A4S3K6Q1_9GAMM|nr:MmoB/DmpM family protein [Panacagrimonas perspica]TDU25532.1 toluene 4-monooxygenase protein D [Panacagrimonas perspica]THD03862.1 monooxygenase [Panacagrimonas perspica]